jgi:multiple sugar transport system ATP-binding protein
MLELRHVTKYYGRNLAVKDLNITCREGEFLVIFGPAGAGKSTTLRLIAGISPLSSGEIWFRDQNLNGIPPENRNLAMAFENYALYSHLTVFDNLAFPLRARKIDKKEIDQRVRKMAELLQITPLLGRRPGFMSGGQRQRVALGRALIRDADVYLLDEPISHLDAKLRHHMRGELKAMCAQWDSTVVYVTHDYKEAMALSDRIAVLNKGRLMQIGTPDEIYRRPANHFVASFLGDPPMSFLDSELQRDNDRYFLRSGGLEIFIEDELAARIDANSPGGQVRLGMRATDLLISPSQNETYSVPVEVYVVETFGYRNIVTSRCTGSGLVQSVSPSDMKFNVRDTAWLNLNVDNIHIFSSSGEAISHPKSRNRRKEGYDGIHPA